MIHWGWLIATAFASTAFGIFIMCCLNANGPSVHDAIWHLSHLFRLIDNAEVCDFRNGVMHGHYDEGAVMAMRALENAERFLLSVGDNYVMGTRGQR